MKKKSFPENFEASLFRRSTSIVVSDLTLYNPWYKYPTGKAGNESYQAPRHMLDAWSELIEILESMQKPEERDFLYKTIQSKMNKKRSLFSWK
jgi:hypothetical protein